MFSMIIFVVYVLMIFLFVIRYPLMLSMVLLIKSLIMSVFMYLYLKKWLGLFLMLIFTGGVMILILFLITLSNHQEVHKFYILGLMILSFYIYLVNLKKSFLVSSVWEEYHLFEYGQSLYLGFIFVYLLVVLFLSVMLCSRVSGAMVNKMKI